MPKQTFFNLPQDKREKILELAIEEFSEKNYKNASISRVVARAGIAKGSFYQYFEDKKDLYLYLINLTIQEKTEILQEMQPPDPDMGLFDYLRWLFRASLNFKFKTPRLAQIGYRAVYADAPLPQETRAVLKAGASAYFRQMVEKAMARGDLRNGIDPSIAAFFLDSIFTSLGEYMMARLGITPEQLMQEGPQVMSTPEATAVIDEVLTTLERGIGRPHPETD